MAMKKFIVEYSVDNKGRFEKAVDAPNALSAKNMARGELGGSAGYMGKKIKVLATREAR